MGYGSRKARCAVLAAALAGLLIAVLAPLALGAPRVSFSSLSGFPSPGTPAQYNKVGILKTGPRNAPNILVLNPGTSSSAAYFAPLAKTIVAQAKGWQVWSVERRENLLEDQSELDKAKAGQVTGQQLFDYYLGYLTNPSISPHYQSIPDADVTYARDWGMNTEIGGLRRVVNAAQKQAKHVVVGGHSLGGSITTAYATWDFNGKAGADGLAGLVYIDGGSRPVPVTAEAAQQGLDKLQSGSPWLTFGGFPAPLAGLFVTTGTAGAIMDPNSASIGQSFPLLPANLKPPAPAKNLALVGYALDVKTSPPTLGAAQAHLGQLDTSTDPQGWERAGAITPIDRYNVMFSGWGLPGLDGSAWYHPQRLSDDAGAVANGNANPAQKILDVHATHGHDLSKKLKIYAFGAALGGPRVLTEARLLARQSGIPRGNLTLVNRASTYAHNDPNSAYPKNDFIKNLIPFLEGIG